MAKPFLPLVIYCDKELSNKIIKIQKELARVTGSRKSIDSWQPHITIGNGVQVDDEKPKTINSLIRDIQEVTKNSKPFKIKVKDFEFLIHDNLRSLGLTHYVVYLKIEKTPELVKLAADIKNKVTDKRFSTYKQPWPYKPHLTVAFGDLTKEGFEKAKKALRRKKFREEMIIDHVALAREDSKGRFKDFKRISFPYN
ncbi:2'-5' RNA ligase family protein [Candidatus Pacearchaeota archaeon]|nr:2'-5' RNA ligase family protein [Candidatus Pacearchaeota archaeon]